MRVARLVNYCCLVTLISSLYLSPLFDFMSSRNLPLLSSSHLIQLVTSDDLITSSVLLQSIQGPATGPLFVNPDNPRYFTDGAMANGKYRAVYLTGSHTWCDLMDCDDNASIPAKFNYTGFLDFLVSKNHNFFRLWRAENVRGGENGDNFWFDPMPYQRSTTCCAFDGGNKFNLNQFNQAYFDRMRQRVIQARDKGIYVSIMLFDGWSIETKFPATHQPWKGHPYKLSNNINNINGDPNGDGQGSETHTLAIGQITALQEAYVKKVIDTVNDLDNVLYEISNESSSNSDAWQYHMINAIKTYEAGKPKQHPVGMTVEYPSGSNADLFASPADWISPNGDLNSPPVATGAKVILADTDHLCGICGDRQWVWKSFTRGENPIFMDIYDNATSGRGIPFTNAKEVEIRNNLGYVRSYALHMNLAAMTPTSNTSLCSTGYCLRNPASSGAEYLVYRPANSGNITVNLSAVSSSKELYVEWFDPATGTTLAAGTVNGGGSQSFTPPFSNDVVLYIYDAIIATFRSKGANDGRLLESTETSGQGGTLNSTGTLLRLGDDALNRQYRAILSFDTSSLPANADIKSATLKLKYAGVSGTDPFTTHGKLLADICEGAFQNNPALELGDFKGVCSRNKVLLFSNSTLDNWYSQSLNPIDFQYINLGGVTQFRLRFKLDDNNDFSADFLKLYSGNVTDEANRPRLVITYYVK